jgi:hypothetical protein
MTTPNIPSVPPLPSDANWDQQMRHFEALQRERSIASHDRLAAAQEAIAALIPQQIAVMQQLVSAPPAGNSSGLTSDDVQIVGGLLNAVRPPVAP